MKQLTVKHRARQAFTLIELLVVIAIIGILAGMILPALAGAKKKAQSSIAKSEIQNLITGIAQYQNDYSRLPATQSAVSAAQQNAKAGYGYSPDYTYGTFRKDAASSETYGNAKVATKFPNMDVGTTTGGYQNCNAEIMDILLGADTYPAPNVLNNPNPNSTINPLTTLNPRKSPYFNARFNSSVTLDMPGISLIDHVYRDPWGNPYIITLDLNYDERCVDTFYGAKGFTNVGNVMIWSFGPDGKFSSSAAVNKLENKDNVTSWQ